MFLALFLSLHDLFYGSLVQCSAMCFKAAYCHTHNESQGHWGITQRKDGDWNVSRNRTALSKQKRAGQRCTLPYPKSHRIFMYWGVLGGDLYVGILLKQIPCSIVYPNLQYELWFAGCLVVLRVYSKKIYIACLF